MAVWSKIWGWLYAQDHGLVGISRKLQWLWLPAWFETPVKEAYGMGGRRRELQGFIEKNLWIETSFCPKPGEKRTSSKTCWALLAILHHLQVGLLTYCMTKNLQGGQVRHQHRRHEPRGCQPDSAALANPETRGLGRKAHAPRCGWKAMSRRGITEPRPVTPPKQQTPPSAHRRPPQLRAGLRAPTWARRRRGHGASPRAAAPGAARPARPPWPAAEAAGALSAARGAERSRRGGGDSSAQRLRDRGGGPGAAGQWPRGAAGGGWGRVEGGGKPEERLGGVGEPSGVVRIFGRRLSQKGTGKNSGQCKNVGFSQRWSKAPPAPNSLCVLTERCAVEQAICLSSAFLGWQVPCRVVLPKVGKLPEALLDFLSQVQGSMLKCRRSLSGF